MRMHLRLVLPLLLVIAVAACSDDPGDLSSNHATPITGPLFNTGPVACLGDFIWNDLNMNGCQDEGEPGIEGVHVSAFRCSDDSFAGDTLSVADGYYAIFLDPGEYYIRIDVPEGWTLTDADQSCGSKQRDSDIFAVSGRSACTVLAEFEIKKSLDVGLYRGDTPPPPSKFGCIGDRVWLDENCNGCQDKDEPGVEGIRVELYNCADEFLDAMETDADGLYCFTDLETGDYYVKFILEGDYSFTHQNACGNDEIDSDADELSGETVCTTIDAGECDKTWDAGLCLKKEDGEGCTPGYWKNHVFAWPEGYEPDDVFDDVFGCEIFGDDTTLYEALWHGGGGIYRLGRHGTAALLSAAHPGVDYGLSVGEVIDAVCEDGDADLLEEHNEMGCPLSGRDPDKDLLRSFSIDR